MPPRHNPNDSSQELRDYFSRILSPTADIADRSLLYFVRRKLFQLHLSSTLSVEDILHEAYFRAEKAISEDVEIRNIPAWVRKVCLNILSEHVRKNISNEKTIAQAKVINEIREVDSFFDIHVEQIGSLISAWNKLTSEEQNLLRMKYVYKWKWVEIAEVLSETENSPVNQVTAKKRGSRALKRLKIWFFEEIREF